MLWDGCRLNSLFQARGQKLQSPAVDPIRIVLFTGEKCYKCPEVARIVHRVVGSAMGESIHVLTVDVDEQPKVADKYEITTLPTILIDDKKVLYGSIDEDDIKTKLWETLINRGRLIEGLHERKKESMLRITMNTLNSVTRQELIREEIGDYCHLGILQQSALSLLALDPLIRPLFYRVGKDLGRYGASPSLCITANPRISSEYRAAERFEEIVRGIVGLFSQPERFPIYMTENAELKEIDSTSALVRVYGSAFSAAIPGIGEPIDYVIAGQIAGMIEVLLGRYVRVEEQDCWGVGARHCDFLVETAEKPEDLPPSASEKSSEDSKTRFERRLTFREATLQVAKQMEESIFMKKQIRKKIGDYCHIGVMQQPFTALKWIDPFCGTLLYSAGFELGIFGPGKEIIWNKMTGMNKEWPLPLPDAVEVVVSYLSHPISILSRQHTFIRIVEASENKVLLSVKGCATASGLPNFGEGELFCDFQAGYIGGRVDLLTERDVVARELQCPGTGHDHCLFEITPV